MEIVTTWQGSDLPPAWTAFLTAASNPPQHGTSMRTTVTSLTELVRMISASFSE